MPNHRKSSTLVPGGGLAVAGCAGILTLAASACATEQEPKATSRSRQDPRRVPWDEILAPKRERLPGPQAKVKWRDDFGAALREARRTNRPLFVTARCLPCKQCAAFDQNVLEGGAELTPLLAQFITVRITDAAALDLRRLPVAGFQDLDLSWWGYFLSPRAELYGVFGGRDEVSDTNRISVAALAQTLRRVLDHHYDPRRAGWEIDGPSVDESVGARTPLQLPGYESWLKNDVYAQKQSCLHCHQVADVLRQPALLARTFDKRRDTAVWPLPENVGLRLERDDGLLVTHVAGGSAAAKAGMQSGDRLGAAGGRRLFGQADFRGVLHRSANPGGRIHVHWLRGGKRHDAHLELVAGWRRTVLDWRMSISQGNIGVGPGFFPLAARGKRVPKTKMAVAPYFGRGSSSSSAYRGGLRPRHVIVAVDGKRPRLVGRAFLVWFRLRYDPGDRVVFTVLDRGKSRDISVALPARR